MVTTAKKTSTVKAPTKRRTTKPAAKKATTTAVHTPVAAKVSRSQNRDYFAGVGRRKSAIARVRLFAKGSGEITVNNEDLAKYFSLPDYISTAKEPIVLLGLEKTVDVKVKVTGGGKAGQAIAVRHGLARALLVMDENYRKALRPAGFLTRDSRIKERKKPGLKRARRAPQFSKR